MTFTHDEIDYLVFTLGGQSGYNPKRLGSGLSGEGAISLRLKLETMRDDDDASPVEADRATETRAA